MSHGGGGGVRKGPKKCHVLFEWPPTISKAMRSDRLVQIDSSISNNRD
jgi:hypothetical protein